MGKIKAIIFDFDGVIADSVNVKTEAFAELYRPYGKEIEEKVVKHHLNNGGMSRYEKFRVYHKEFLNLPITEKEVQNLANEFSKLVVKKVIEAPYIRGTKEFIETNYQDYHFYISSGTPQEEIKYIAEMRGLDTYFREIYGSPEKKDKHVEKIIEKNNYRNDEVVFIGDAESDRKAAKVNDIKFIGVKNQNIDFSNEKYKINDLSSLLNILSRL